MRQVVIASNKGQIITLEVTDILLKNVRESLLIEDSEEITDNHIKYYIVSSMKNALGATDVT